MYKLMICVFLNACYASEIVSLKLINVYLFEMYTHYVPKMHIFSLHLLTYLLKLRELALTWDLEAWALGTKT